MSEEKRSTGPTPRLHVSHLLQRTPDDALLERIEAVVARTVEAVAEKYLTGPQSTPPADRSMPMLYAVYTGLQLVCQLVQDRGGDGIDPLLPPIADITAAVEEMERTEAFQQYLLADTTALPGTDQGEPA